MDLGIRVAKVLGWILAAIIALLGYIYFFGGPYEHRFRLTFDVIVDGQLKQGTGIISVFDSDLRNVPLAHKDWIRKGKGPSPWVDLGTRGILAVAIETNAPNYRGTMPFHGSMLSFVAFYGATHGNSKVSEATVTGIRNMQGKRELPAEVAQFIWFPNPDDPNSAVFLPPASATNLTDEGIQLGTLTVEITDDKPDDSLFVRLPWLRGMLERELQKPTRRGPGRGIHVMHLLGDIF
jgi:hypothetical protein